MKTKNTIAQKHGYTDFFQIDMTELSPSERMEVKSQILDECVTVLESQKTELLKMLEEIELYQINNGAQFILEFNRQIKPRLLKYQQSA